MKPTESPGSGAFRILLVSPVDKAMLGQDFYFKFPHLSLPTLAAYTPAGASVEIVDEKFHPVPEGQGYDLVGITAMTPAPVFASRNRKIVPATACGYWRCKS